MTEAENLKKENPNEKETKKPKKDAGVPASARRKIRELAKKVVMSREP